MNSDYYIYVDTAAHHLLHDTARMMEWAARDANPGQNPDMFVHALHLAHYNDKDKIKTLKAVRFLTNMGLKEAKDFIEEQKSRDVPMPIMLGTVDELQVALSSLTTGTEAYDNITFTIQEVGIASETVRGLVNKGKAGLDVANAKIEALQIELDNEKKKYEELRSKLSKALGYW